MIGSLEGRVALVTGCTGGIGSEVCRALEEAGATVIGADLPAAAGAWGEGRAEGTYYQLDVDQHVEPAELVVDGGYTAQ